MSVERYFICPPESIGSGGIIITGPEAHHLSRVVRARIGDMVNLLDGEGTVARARVSGIDDSSVRLDTVSIEVKEPQYPVDIAVSLIKAGRMDQIVEKSAELGVRRVIPVLSDRSVWRGGGKEADKKRERLRRKAVSACKQSGQPYFPVIEKVTGIGDLAGMMSGFNAVYLADRGGGDIASVSTAGDERGVLGIVGPEGGFTDEETKIIISSGAKRVTLGPNRLRADTAAVCLAFGLLAAYR